MLASVVVLPGYMIYVDEIKKCLPLDETGGRWRWNHYCHMMGESVDELHTAAAAIGLKRDYFQDLPGFPHYDLTLTKRRMAVRAGAVEISRRDMVDRASAIYGLKLYVPGTQSRPR